MVAFDVAPPHHQTRRAIVGAVAPLLFVIPPGATTDPSSAPDAAVGDGLGAPADPSAALELTDIPEGWRAYRDPTNTVAMALPPFFESLDLAQNSVFDRTGPIARRNPWLAATLRNQASPVDRGVIFLALDVESEDSDLVALTTIVAGRLGGFNTRSLDEFAERYARSVEQRQSTVGPVTVRPVQVGAIPSAVLTIRAISRAPTSHYDLTTRQYLVPAGRYLYSIELRGRTVLEPSLKPTFEQIAAYLRVAPPDR